MTEDKEILIISAVFPPEPVVSAKISHDLAEALSSKHQITVLCPKPSRPAGFLFAEASPKKEKGVNRIVLNSYICPQSKLIGRTLESISFGFHCARYIKNNCHKIKVIYLNSWPIFSQFLIVRQAKKKSIPSIVHYQDIYPESFIQKTKSRLAKKALASLILPIDKYVSKNATRLIVISEKMMKVFIKTRFIQEKKITLISNWQDEKDFSCVRTQDKKASERNQTVFMYLGNIGPVARVEWLIQCFAAVATKNMKLIIAGSGSCKQACVEEAKKNQDADIDFQAVPDGKVAEYQGKADVLVLAVCPGAASSSIPSKVPAYMFSRKPILAAVDLNSDTACAIRDAQGGILVPPDNPQALSNAFSSFAKMNDLEKQELGEKNYEYAINHFSKSKNLAKLIQNIEEVYYDNKTYPK